MNKKLLNIFFLGCGRISNKHFDAINQLKDQGYPIQRVAICDLNSDLTHEIKKKYGFDVFESMDTFARNNDKQFNIASILTPSGLHPEHVINLSNYVENIIVEKPMALRISEADEMILSCAKRNTRLFVVKQNEFNKPVVFAKSLINQNLIGRLNIITTRVRWSRDQSYYDQSDWRGTWKYDGGVLSNQASHHIDLVEWFGEKVKSVYAISRTFGVNIECEDSSIATLEFKNGAIGSIEATTSIRPQNLEGSISLIGSKGYVIIGGKAVNKITDISLEGISNEEAEKMVNENSYETDSVYGNGHVAFYKNTFDSILNNSPPLVDGIEGRKSVELINAMYKSILEGKKIDLSSELMDFQFGNN